MHRFFIFVVLLLTIGAGAPAQKRALTIRDLYHITSVDDPHFSPDKTKILFTVHQDFLEQGKGNTEIYCINRDGTGLRQITNNPANDDSPRWSPDGKSILFVSTRSKSPQAWLLPVDGGEPRQLTRRSPAACATRSRSWATM